jgi:glycosyltransferase involved in cell wall biosynthesis
MADSKQRPVKVLNALWQLDVGGIESSLVGMLSHMDRERYQSDFLVTSQYEGDYDAIVRKMGGRIVLGKERFNSRRNLRELAAINKRFGPYDVLQSHRLEGNGPLLRAAHQLQIPVRIAYSHTLTSAARSTFGRARAAYGRYLTWKHCTHGLAVSRTAADSLFGSRWEHDPRFEVLPMGCDFDAFQALGSRERIRRELAIDDDTIVLAHLGNFEDASIHEFIVEVGWELEKLSSQFRFVLIGDGATRYHIKCQVEFAGLENRVIFLDTPANLPLLLLAMDGFICPSMGGTLGIYAVAAQAAGLVCFLSDQVDAEVDVVPELLHRLPLEAGASGWAKEIFAHSRAQLSQPEALAKCRTSYPDIETYTERHLRIYADVLGRISS